MKILPTTPYLSLFRYSPSSLVKKVLILYIYMHYKRYKKYVSYGEKW